MSTKLVYNDGTAVELHRLDPARFATVAEVDAAIQLIGTVIADMQRQIEADEVPPEKQGLVDAARWRADVTYALKRTKGTRQLLHARRGELRRAEAMERHRVGIAADQRAHEEHRGKYACFHEAARRMLSPQQFRAIWDEVERQRMAELDAGERAVA